MGFVLTVRNRWTSKDQVKASLSNCYIGYGREGSSTYSYYCDAIRQGVPVNDSIIPLCCSAAFVSINGRPNKMALANTSSVAMSILEAGG